MPLRVFLDPESRRRNTRQRRFGFGGDGRSGPAPNLRRIQPRGLERARQPEDEDDEIVATNRINAGQVVPQAPQRQLPQRSEFIDQEEFDRRERALQILGLGSALSAVAGGIAGGGDGALSPVTAVSSGIAQGAGQQFQALQAEEARRTEAFAEGLQEARQANLEARQTEAERRFQVERDRFQEGLQRETERQRFERERGQREREFERKKELERLESRLEGQLSPQEREKTQAEIDRIRAQTRASRALARKREQETGDTSDVDAGLLESAFLTRERLQRERRKLDQMEASRDEMNITAEEIEGQRQRVSEMESQFIDITRDFGDEELDAFRMATRPAPEGPGPSGGGFEGEPEGPGGLPPGARQSLGQRQEGQTPERVQPEGQRTRPGPGTAGTEPPTAVPTEGQVTEEQMVQALDDFSDGEIGADRLFEISERAHQQGLIADSTFQQIRSLTNR